MSVMISIALFGWIPLTILLFLVMPARRAAIYTVLLGVLFLPEGVAAVALPGLPNYVKSTAIAIAVLLGVVIFDGKRLASFRAGWVDLPMLVWCLVPLASALRAGLGVHAGLSAVYYQTLGWGVPYLIGRLYCNDREGLRELAMAVFIGGLIYVPLCLYEIRMSPQLNVLVYGYHQAAFISTRRFGGWRPVVFLQHGLALGMWMTAASLAGIWLWRCGTLKQLRGWSMKWLVPLLLVTTVLCKSTGALAELMIGVVALFLIRRVPRHLAVVALIACVPLYMATRTSGLVRSGTLTSIAEVVFPHDRVASFQTRLHEEDDLTDHAMQRPLLGWGPWGAYRTNAQGYDIVKATDGLWVIMLGKYGLIGLMSLTAVFLVPAFRLTRVWLPGVWCDPRCAGGAVLAMILVVYMIDCLMNAMPNPVFVMAAGAVAAARPVVVLDVRQVARARRAVAA